MVIKKTNITDTKTSAKTEVKKDDTRKVTYEKFCKIEIGSTYEEVKSI